MAASEPGRSRGPSGFERQARRVRRAVRRLPALEPLVDRAGLEAWRRHVARQAHRTGSALDPNRRLSVDPNRIRTAHAIDPSPTGRVRGGRWDLAATVLELPSEPVDDGEPGPEIVVAIDRRGRIGLVDGLRRLAAARDSGADRVPAVAAVRHAAWDRFCLEMAGYAADRGGASYQPFLHPDLEAIPAAQGHERFDLILEHLPVRSGRLLDIGSNKGYFAHRFEEVGFDCVASERSRKELYCLRRLRDASELRFEIVAGSVTDVPGLDSFDVVLALNVFHHFLKTASGTEDLWRLLDRLRPSFLVFEPHSPGEGQMKSAHLDPAPDEFVDLVLAHSHLSQAKRIGAAADGRPVYVLRR